MLNERLLDESGEAQNLAHSGSSSDLEEMIDRKTFATNIRQFAPIVVNSGMKPNAFERICIH